jgi:hypothetical protein
MDQSERDRRDALDDARIQKNLADTSPKTGEDIKRLHDEWLELCEKNETGLGFHTFANISWNDYGGWEATGQWPPPKKVDICVICEKELEPVSYDSIGQPYYGGELKVSFNYGSRYDYMGYQLPVTGPPYTDHDMGEPMGVITSGTFVGTEPREETLNSESRAERLASCHRIIGVICDDCFEKKAHLFRGYQKPDDVKLQLLVE